MKKNVRAFTFIEVIVYIGLFSLLGTALFSFAWDMIVLKEKSYTQQTITEEARLSLEYMKFQIRNSAGIDEANSSWDNNNGKLVVEIFGSSDTVTFEKENGGIIMRRSGRDSVRMHSRDFQARDLIFESYRDRAGKVSSVGIQVTLETPENISQEYRAVFSLKTSVSLRNHSL